MLRPCSATASPLGMGAEIGISTDKLHARGPMGLEELTSYKFVIEGDGHVMGPWSDKPSHRQPSFSEEANCVSQIYQTISSTGFRTAGDIARVQRAADRGGVEVSHWSTRTGVRSTLETVQALWRYLVASGWQVIEDPLSLDRLRAPRSPVPYNDTIAACETGFCKTEFSLAHVANLFELTESIDALRSATDAVCTQEHNVRFPGLRDPAVDSAQPGVAV